MIPKKSTLTRLGFALLAAAGTVANAQTDYPSTVLSQSPAGYWRLNETALPVFHANAANSGSLGSSANAYYIGSPTRGLSGPFAGTTSASLNGSSQYITNAYSASINPGTFSMEFWVKPAQVPFTSASVGYVAANVHIGSPRAGWYLAQDNGATFGNGSAFTFRMFNQNGTTPSVSLSVPVTNSGAWYHLVISYDGTNAYFYENGVLANSGTPTTFSGNKYVPNGDAGLTVGCRSDKGFPWPGQVAEVAEYSGALSSTQVANHYAAGTTAPATYSSTVLGDSPLLYFHYTEASDVQVYAANSGSLGSSATGTYQPGTVPGDVGPQPSTFPGFESTNAAVTFTANGSAVALPALNLNTNTVTIAGWVKAVGSQGIGAGIFVQDTATTYAGLTTDANTGGYGLGYVWNDNDANTYSWSPTTDSGLPPLNDSEWAFVALVIRPTQAEIYISSPTIPFASATNHLAHVSEKFNGTTLIGSDAGYAAYSFNGSIDEVSVYNRSMSAGDLYTQYASSVGGVAPKLFADLATPTLFVGDTLSLSADVGGTPPLSYQWYNSGGAIAGATNAAYVKANAQTSDNSTYYVVVTNAFGTVTSGSAVVSLTPTFFPAIVTAPAGTTLYPGGTLNLSVVASGGGLKYQWKKGGTNLTAAISSSFVVPSVVLTNSGVYSVVITNNSGSITSTPVTVSVIVPATNTYDATIVADAPEAWFRLDDAPGSTLLHDSMGRHDGYYTNTSGTLPTLGVAGALVGNANTSVFFDGSSKAYGVVPYADTLNSENFTIEAWVKTPLTSGTEVPVSSHSSSFKGYGIWTVPSGKWSGEVSQSGANYYVPSATSAAGIVPGAWTHVVMTYATNSSLHVYVNGQWDGNGYVDFARNVDSPLIIGGFGPAPITDLFDGQVDEVAVYTYAISLAQAQNHYSKGKFANPIPPFFVLTPQSNEIVSNTAATFTLNGLADGPLPITYQWLRNGVAITGATNTSLTLPASYTNAGSYVLRAVNPNGTTNSTTATIGVLPPNPSYVNVTNGLVLHLTFDNTYADASGRGNNGTAAGLGDAPSFTDGRLGGAAVHYSTTTTTGLPENSNTNTSVVTASYVTLGNPADLQFSSNVDFTVSYWFRLPSGYLGGDLPFFCSSTNSTHNNGFTFAPGYTNGAVQYSVNGVGYASSPNAVNDGTWHHIIHSISRTGYAFTYLDGYQVDSQIANGIGDMNNPGGTINIGQDPTGLYAEPGSADVDDLAVWRRALTQYEAYSVYYAATNANASFNVPGTVALNLATAGTNIVVSWTPGASLGTLMTATNLTGPWVPAGAYTPSFTVTPSAGQKFFRLSLPQ